MGQSIPPTSTKLVEDYFFWKTGEVEAAKFYAVQPPPVPGVMPKDYDCEPHTNAQFRVMRHVPHNPFEAYLVVDAMAAWTEGGGEVPLSGLKGLRSFVKKLMRSAELSKSESALATSILRSADKPVEGRA